MKSPTPQSSTSTALEPIRSHTTSGNLTKVPEPSLVDDQIAVLQGELVTEKDDRKQERFLWFAACGLLFMVLSFMAAGSLAGSIVALIYVALLLVLSRVWGFEGLWEALHAAKGLLPGGKPNSEE